MKERFVSSVIPPPTNLDLIVCLFIDYHGDIMTGNQ